MSLICKVKGHDYSGTYSLTPKDGEKIDCVLFCSRCGNIVNLISTIEKLLPLLTKGVKINPNSFVKWQMECVCDFENNYFTHSKTCLSRFKISTVKETHECSGAKCPHSDHKTNATIQ